MKNLFAFIKIKKPSVRIEILLNSKIALQFINNKASMPHKRPFVTASSKGSITVEAAVVVPIFLICVAMLLGYFGVLKSESDYLMTMDKAAEAMSLIEYLGDDTSADEFMSDIDLGVFSNSIKANDEDVEIRISSGVDLPFHLGTIGRNTFTVQTKRRAWTGRIITETDGDDASSEYVYVTENGTVYHKTLSCRCLDLSIKTVSFSEVGNYRNNDGSKYYPCPVCGKNTGSTVCITEDGVRYHFDRNCMMLKRTCKKVKLSETSLPACSYCAQ